MGGQSSKSNGQQAQNILPYIQAFERETSPLRNAAFGQVTEALTTGGVGAQIPAIQRSVEQSRQATSQALRDTGGQLQAAGLDSTPFGMQTLAQLSQQGRQQASQIGPAYAASQAQAAPQLASSLIQQILAGLSAQGVTKSRSGGGGI